MKRKSDQTIVIPIWIKGLNNKYGIDIRRIRLENSGENRSLQIIFKFTPPGTPQQNSVAERKIPTLVGREMMNQAGLNQEEKRIFWCEVISTATKLDNIMVRTDRTKPPHTLFFNKDAKYM